MKPIQFDCTATLRGAPAEIAKQILDLARWPDFTGFGPLPGIRSASFEVRTPGVVGTRIQVVNRDGSKHVEEIVVWDPSHAVQLRMSDFSMPVARLATHFDETWRFTPQGAMTHVVREFSLHPKCGRSKFMLWIVSKFLRRAVDRHFRRMQAEAGGR
jgi:hypothetical protein